jgi:predicted Zn finger-like uncharacterized protein
MAIQTACPHCGTAYNLTDALAGQSVRCRECQDVFDVRSTAIVAHTPPFSRDAESSERSALAPPSVPPSPPAASRRTSTPLLGYALLAAASLCLATLFAGIFYVYAIQASGRVPSVSVDAPAANSPDDKWSVLADPGPKSAPPVLADQAGIATDSANSVVFPTTSAPYAAVKLPGDDTRFQVFDLLRWSPLGQPQQLDLPRATLPVLSPTGQALAWPTNATRPTVEVRTVADGKTVRIPAAESSGIQLLMADFLARDRLLTVTRLMQGPGAAIGTYRGWDLSSGKVEWEFSFPVLFHPRLVTLSPGRNYLAMQRSQQGHRLFFWDTRTGSIAGSFEFQGKDDSRGDCAGLAFSNDGRQIAMLWRRNEKPKTWGRLLCWDVATRKKLCDHAVGYLLPQIDSLWSRGGKRSLQWLPDGSGWLLFDHLVLRRSDGTLAGKLPPEPKNDREIVDRVFLGRDHVSHFTEGASPRLTFLPLSSSVP